MRGIVSCLSLQPLSSPSSHSDASSLLAAGTWTRWVSLYDAAGLGGTVANWSIASAADSDAKISGGGVSQVLWSPCGRYLFVVERKSRGVLIYDVRVTGRLVGWLKGRAAETNQRLGVEVFSGGNAESESVAEVWAGDTDGLVKVWNWRGIGEEDGKEGEGMSPTSEWNSHGSAVTGVAVHPSGVVVATSSGQRQDIGSFDEEETDSWDDNESYDSDEAEGDDDESFITAQSTTSSRTSKRLRKPPDNSIKIWRL
jgi:WD40 repeat protein